MSNRDPHTYEPAPHSDSEGSSSSIDVRPSQDSARNDHEVLDDEVETQDLLLRGESSRNGLGSHSAQRGVFSRLRDRREERQLRKQRRGHEGTKELVYEMEEGGPKLSPSPTTSEGSEGGIDREKLGMALGRKTSRRSRLYKFTLIHAVIAVLFVALAFGAYKATSVMRKKKTSAASLVSNGTSLFAPTTIYISLDGFRADFLQRGLTPTLNAFVKEGVSPRYINPSFPSLTFPNHFTLATGLYPESHGVVGNTFWAPEYQEQFFYTHPKHSMQPKWWDAEPIWVTAEHQNVPTAIHMWPGSEAHLGDVEPTFLDKYNGSEVLPKKVDRILELLDIPSVDDDGALLEDKPRPQLIAAYVPNVDADGHLYGPNSTEIRTTIEDVDEMLGSLFQGLEARNLSGIVNVVIVSDHGMATTSTERLLQLEDLVDIDKVDKIDGWPHYGLRLKDPSDLEKVHADLMEKAKSQSGFDVYLRDVDMPLRYHFKSNERIAPLWIMPRAGWAVVKKDEMNVAEAQQNGDTYHPRGLHGYDHEHPLMRAIFVARGPAFPHKPGSRLEVFQNIEVYNIVCDSIGVEPLANNGTLRLPLVPVGMHSDLPNEDEVDVAHDNDGAEDSPPASPSVSDFIQSATDSETSSPTRPIVKDGKNKSDEELSKAKNAKQWWQWVKIKYGKFSAWAKGLLDKAMKDKNENEDAGKSNG